jgi:hypothetical protein
MKRLAFLLFLFSMPAFAHSVALTWKAPTTGPAPDHYKVYRSITKGTGYVLLSTVPATSLAFTNGSNPDGTPLPEGSTFFYVVTSVVGTQESGNSNEVNATIPVTTTTPQPPALNPARRQLISGHQPRLVPILPIPNPFKWAHPP